MSEHFEQLRKEKELIKMREALMSDWRRDLMEEDHPYVDVMPSSDQKEKDAKKKKKEEEKPEKEEVKEGFFSSVNKKKQAAARERLAKHKAAMEGGGVSPYYGKLKDGKVDKGTGKDSWKGTGKDPWATHPDEQKAFAKEEVEQIDEFFGPFISKDEKQRINKAMHDNARTATNRNNTRQQMKDRVNARRGTGGGSGEDAGYSSDLGKLSTGVIATRSSGVSLLARVVSLDI